LYSQSLRFTFRIFGIGSAKLENQNLWYGRRKKEEGKGENIVQDAWEPRNRVFYENTSSQATNSVKTRFLI
jgi:hypothetical protein